MEAKSFFEVFPTLSLQGFMRQLLEHVLVTHVTANRSRSSLHIYIESDILLKKQDIEYMERAIKEQLFAKIPTKVQVIERFRLGDAYTLPKLWEAYRDSILYELQQDDPMSAALLENGDITVSADGSFVLSLEESSLFRLKEKELRERLQHIFVERCAVEAHVHIVFHPEEAREDTEDVYEREAMHMLAACADDAYAQLAQNANSMAALPEEMPPEGLPWETDGSANGGQAAENAAAGQQNAGKGQTHAQDTAQPLKKTAAGEKEGKNGEADKQGKGGKNGQNTAFGKKSTYRARAPKSPDLLYGRGFEGEPMRIEEIVADMGEVTIRGQVIFLDTRPISNGQRTLVIMNITDDTDTISVKLFVTPEVWEEELASEIKKGAFLKIHGMTGLDRFDHEISIASNVSIMKSMDFRTPRMDTAKEKRVELHCHTKMSDMDGVTAVEDLIDRAIAWGHEKLAITDHGVVQGFPLAFHHLQKKGIKPEQFQMIYGVEGYLVDDLKPVVQDEDGQPLDTDYVVFDLETTGLRSDRNEIIEIGAVKVQNGEITDRFSTFVNPEVPIPYRITELTSIDDGMVREAPKLAEILPQFLEFSRGCVMVAHNAEFDMGFIDEKSHKLGIYEERTSLDTVALARVLLPELRGYKLDQVAKALKISLGHHHRAVDDAECTAMIFLRFLSMLKEQGKETLAQINEMSVKSPKAAKKLPTYHIILLAQTEEGRVNLYRLISASHLDYYNKRPRIPKSMLTTHRKGILIGSACEAGELFQAVLNNRSRREIARLVKFYDYLEIQPIGNNAFMLRDEKYGMRSEEDLRDLNRIIVRLGEEYNKPVVATCDVHFMDPQDELYRRIIMAGKGFADADMQAPLYLHTTDEMLAEFAYLGDSKAKEVVVTNTRAIAESIDYLEPVRADKCPPVIPGSDQELRDLCHKKAHSMYGPELPKIVSERLEKELHSIISNGYAVMYIIAERLVKKSNEDGYLVGSRGSVGSSFVATMSGITEVNPLPPHYYCDKCFYSDFDSEEVRAYAGGAGCDMPEKTCPVCGAPLHRDGFDIPFETFLGFYGDKEPDIDLNFSGEYQSHAHDYTEVIFGKGQTFRAGTIGTLADKTAYGYVMKYYEEHGVVKRRCEMERLASGLAGIRRTTGQHPGGIVVLPKGEEIHSFTPVQHPANDMNTPIITTHFEYHSIDHNLLKLDILGHDDPTMVRRLQDLTGIDPVKLPLTDEKVMSLFCSPEALGIRPEDIGGCPTGTLGIPEFGTDFVIRMLVATQPKQFADLVRISGLSHGTDVWTGNAQTLIEEGKATISTAICTRDDIMLYLIRKQLEPGDAFKIMESVRKGRGLSEEWEKDMLAHDVPDWYIWSCKKIKYMFPKAHAAAYVMMAIRVGYYKVYYPLAYYAAFFSIRASAFNFELMCQGPEKLQRHIDAYEENAKKAKLKQKESDTLRDMRLVREMYARGFEFMPIDLYRVKADRFQIIDGKLMPSLSAIDGLGEKAASAIEAAAAKGRFLSKDDFRSRCGVGQTITDQLSELGILSGLPESNQLSFFDL